MGQCIRVVVLAGMQAIDVIKVSAAKRDGEYIKTLWPRLQICALCVNKTVSVADLQSDEALQQATCTDLSLTQMQADVQEMAVSVPEFSRIAEKFEANNSTQ